MIIIMGNYKKVILGRDISRLEIVNHLFFNQKEKLIVLAFNGAQIWFLSILGISSIMEFCPLNFLYEIQFDLH